MPERKCDMFDCKETVGNEGLGIMSLGRTFYICEKCVGDAKKLRVLLVKQSDGSYVVGEMVGF